MKRINSVTNTKKLLDAARTAGLPVIHAPLIFDPRKKKGFLAYLSSGKIFTKGSWKSEFTPGIYGNGDVVCQGRYSFNPFDGSDLHDFLQKNQIKNIIFCGFTTDQCVLKGVRTAEKLGYASYMAADCTASFFRFVQEKTEKKSSIVLSSDITEALSGRGI